MKLNIRTAKKNLFADSQVYYVPSKSGGEEHIVVKTPAGLFCDCKDFMTRHLPLFGTAGFSHCTHGKQVAAFSMHPPASFAPAKPKNRKPKTAKRYRIFVRRSGDPSIDYPGVYTKKQAEKLLGGPQPDDSFRVIRPL